MLELELSHQLDQLTLLERLSASELKRKASEAKTKMTSKSPESLFKLKAILISPKGLFGGSDAYWPPKVSQIGPFFLRLIQLAYQRMLAKKRGGGRQAESKADGRWPS